ncbi:hypothetical protein L211DRAFT_867989 [Terfezia boudieri ATCC MYA-4762]|uniref:Crinkler effector protein N-terminal domain-containing protein n=1 Tax=Terfezia boudieri ATCC MYA-4762 TaxID=1051890 RepID=A0A3N4LN18_9PEZI|nr:hypothetical protein L211DRAFT_867989 [Terfezia boudieri ATCC MYA-4762]
MSERMTLFCIVHNKQDEVPFSVKVNGGDTVDELKQLIKATCTPKMDNITSHHLKLRIWNQPGDIDYVHLDGIAMLNPMKKVRDIFCGDGFPKEECVHIIITVPEPETTPVEDRKELHHLRKIVEQLKNSFHEKDAELATLKEDHRFDLIVEPKRILSISWTVNINTATLNELKEKISKDYYPHLGSTLLKLILKPKSSKPFSPDSDKDLRVLLRDLVQANEKVLIISVETPQKPFSEWCLSAVKELYGIIGEFPKYKCGRAPIVNTKTLPSLLDILNEFSIITPILHESTEATASLYVHSILNKVAADFLSSNSSSVPGFELASDTLEQIFIIKPQKQVTGVYGRGPVDYAIDLSNGVTVCVTEVKREDNAITKGLAQNAVQIESALWESRKRKRPTCDLDGTDNDEVPNYCFGIVTNAKEWHFLKCTIVNGTTEFMVSRSYTVSYGKESTKNDVEVLAEIIKWLLMEAQSSTTDGRKKAKVVTEMPRSD